MITPSFSGHSFRINPLTTKIGQPFFGHKSPAARARELFKPSADEFSKSSS